MENAMLRYISSAVDGDQVLALMVNTIKPIQKEEEEEKQTGKSSLDNEPSMIKPTISEFSGVDTDAHVANVIASFLDTISHRRNHFLGYPTNQDFDYDALVQLLRFFLNNMGDPFIGNSFSLNSNLFELCVLDWFAKLWEIEKNEYWGYVTNGGTEGNFHGILVGRELYPDGILYTSRDSHYSVFKAARLFRVKCVIVGTLISGEIDYNELKASILDNKDKPAIINLNLGTTIKGGIDDVDHVLQVLEECGFTQDRFYIHCDAALFGLMLPFLNGAPRITFKKPIGSVTTSGHKFLGCPVPCSVIITRLKYVDLVSKEVEYISSRDTTISGSRGGLASIFLWYALNKKGINGLRKEVEECNNKAIYFQNCLRGHGIGAMLNKFSNTVVFERPLDDAFSHKWSLSNEGNVSHVIVMRHVTVKMLDSFVSDFVKNRSIWYKDSSGKNSPCIGEEIGAENCSCLVHHKKLILL
ncbi:serine decarboxylase-like [Prosopis cineraria]|uniref:serine decarboxylase-like n=1 Tax=Prosopis cineraria TaxID=364024 RepID=UPI00241087C9|nr:serine decarboxylase-like [Prosopis cineraria]